MNYIIQLTMAFIGSFGFAGIFNIKREHILPASFGGFLSWGIYLALEAITKNSVLCYFIASLSFTFYAEIMARKKKTPATLFLVPAAIPLIPGGSLYTTMWYAVQGEKSLCLQQGIHTLLLAGAIACGILCAMTLWSIVEKIYKFWYEYALPQRYKKKQKKSLRIEK